jgi:hypothetical protein
MPGLGLRGMIDQCVFMLIERYLLMRASFRAVDGGPVSGVLYFRNWCARARSLRYHPQRRDKRPL